MRKNALRNLSSFLLALVLTAAAVVFLSAVTGSNGDPALAQTAQAAQAELSAAAAGGLVASPLVCAGGFAAVLAFAALGLLLYRREKGRGGESGRGRRSYIPRADMAFSGRNRV